MVSPFDVSRTLPVGGGFLVPCSSPGPAVIKQLVPMVTVVPGQGVRFQPVCPIKRKNVQAETFLKVGSGGKATEFT